MKTVCFCNSTLAWGGGEKWHLEAACSLAARGWRVLVLCHPQGVLHTKALLHPSLVVIPFFITRFSFLHPLKRQQITAFLRREQVQSVVMNLPADVKCVVPAAQAAGVKNIVYRRGSAIAVKNSWLNRHLYGQLTALIVNSEETRRLVLVNNSHMISAEKIHVLPNAVDIAAFDTALAGAMAKEGAGCAPLVPFADSAGRRMAKRPFVLGNAGRLNRQKAQQFLLFLARELEDRGFFFHLLIAGCGEREEELKKLAVNLGVEQRVSFLGFCDNVSVFWKEIDLFVLSSLWEGFGYVLLEAMLAQKPVFAFSVSNIPELVREGENGRLFSLPPENAGYGSCEGLTHMADAVVALAADPQEQKRMGENGRAFACSHFSQQAAMERLEKILCPQSSGT